MTEEPRRPGLLDGYGVSPHGPRRRDDAGTQALEALEGLGERVHEREALAQEREREAEKRLRRARIAVLAAVVAAVVLSVAGATTGIYAATRAGVASAEEVAPRVAAEVSAASIRDSRANRLTAARSSLVEANAILTSRGLGTVPEPDPSRYVPATLPDAYVIRASTAQTLAYLPDPIVAGLRVDPSTGRLVVPASILLRPDGGGDSSSGGTIDPGAPGVELLPLEGEDPASGGTPPSGTSPAPGGGTSSARPPGGGGGGGTLPTRPPGPRPLLPSGVPLPRLPSEIPLPRVPLLGGIVT